MLAYEENISCFSGVEKYRHNDGVNFFSCAIEMVDDDDDNGDGVSGDKIAR